MGQIRNIFMIVFSILLLFVSHVQKGDCCSHLDYTCSAARRYIVDRTGYWIHTWGRSPRSYTYVNDMPRESDDSTRVMTLNYQRVNYATRRWFHIWSGGNPWFSNHRLWRIYDLMYHFKPDVVGLQEVSTGMAVGLARLLSPRYAFVETDELKYTDLVNNPILYNTNRYTVQDVSVPLYKSEASSEHSGDLTLITQAKLSDEKTGSLLTMTNAHVGGLNSEESLDYTTLTDIAQAARTSPYPHYIVGDFNTYLSRVENILSMQSAYQGSTSTYIGWDAKKEPSGDIIDGITYPSNTVSCQQSDVVVYSDEVGPDGTMHHDKRLSDHRPVVADFRSRSSE